VLKLKYHAKCRRIERKIPWATIYGAILQGRYKQYPDGTKIFRWLGVKVVMTWNNHIITVFDALKNG
jgi:hypothetical protein